MIYGERIEQDAEKNKKTIIVRKKKKPNEKKQWQDMLLEFRQRLEAPNT